MNMIAQARNNGELDLERFTKSGLERLNPRQELEQEPNMPAGHLASLFNAQGPNLELPHRLRRLAARRSARRRRSSAAAMPT